MSMMRLIVWAAEFVCSVPNVKWPVSAIFIAASTVSRSRISPISTMSGSSRSAARSALEKLLVSLCTSRWLTRHPLCAWMYSIGSSMVRMWSRRSVLILSIIAASVVDLPLPVGEHAVDEMLGLRGGHLRQLQPAQMAVDPDLRRRVGRDVQVRPVDVDHRFQQFGQRWHRCQSFGLGPWALVRP